MSSAILLAVLLLFAARILFAIEGLLCKIIDILYDAFEIFAGIKTVIYNNKPDYLIDVFFSNPVVTAVYWGMACIGFALLFGFAIVSIVRKLFDSTGEKIKATYSQILVNCFKSILLILLMTAIVSATINATGVLMRSIDRLFDSAELIANPPDITFDDEDRYNMYQVLDTIADYSLTPAYDSRFNLNSCFNTIRPAMQQLDRTNFFRFSYEGIEDEHGNNNSWQYALLQIYKASNIYEEVDIDAYNEPLNNAILDCMHQLKTNKDFKPLSYYIEPAKSGMSLGTTLGRTIMLTCSFGCANNSAYDENPGISDSLRYPYYVGEKNVYSYSEVENDFDIGLFTWNHVVCLAVAYFLIKEMLIILINSVARIFNIILLYIAAPGFLAVMPLDDGGKFKQWTTAFVIQSLSLFGSVFAVRLLMIFIPIIMGTNLQLFTNSFANGVAKLAFVIGICVTSEKANGLISGILADNAGYQSIMAGDVGGGLASSAMSLAGKTIGAAAKKGFQIGAGTLGAIGDATGLTTAKKAFEDKVGISKLKNLGQSMRDKGGIVGALRSGISTNDQERSMGEQMQSAADAKDTKDFRSNLLNTLTEMVTGGQGGGNQGGGNQGSGNQGGGGPKKDFKSNLVDNLVNMATGGEGNGQGGGGNFGSGSFGGNFGQEGNKKEGEKKTDKAADLFNTVVDTVTGSSTEKPPQNTGNNKNNNDKKPNNNKSNFEKVFGTGKNNTGGSLGGLAKKIPPMNFNKK